MTEDSLRRRANAVRDVTLEAVLALRGAVQDRHDPRKWHTERGPLSVSACRFMNWRLGRGGGGAIDLVMHLGAMDCDAAVTWLEQHLALSPVVLTMATAASLTPTTAKRLQLPIRSHDHWNRVQQYLTRCRLLEPEVLGTLQESGWLYADSRANAVFLLIAGNTSQPVGAELRGIGPYRWRGMAPGSRKNAGYFWVGPRTSRTIVLCESAIDAISCFQIHPDYICISTSGVRANPAWLGELLSHGYRIYCGFDSDEPGEIAAHEMIARNPAVQRLLPPAHDWNDALAGRHAIA